MQTKTLPCAATQCDMRPPRTSCEEELGAAGFEAEHVTNSAAVPHKDNSGHLPNVNTSEITGASGDAPESTDAHGRLRPDAGPTLGPTSTDVACGDADLRAVVEAWPTLPDAVRASWAAAARALSAARGAGR